MKPEKETIVRVMNTLEWLYDLMYYVKTAEAEKEYVAQIKMYEQYLGFDSDFKKLKIKW